MLRQLRQLLADDLPDLLAFSNALQQDEQAAEPSSILHWETHMVRPFSSLALPFLMPPSCAAACAIPGQGPLHTRLMLDMLSPPASAYVERDGRCVFCSHAMSCLLSLVSDSAALHSQYVGMSPSTEYPPVSIQITRETSRTIQKKQPETPSTMLGAQSIA